jgi:hypothetical protein
MGTNSKNKSPTGIWKFMGCDFGSPSISSVTTLIGRSALTNFRASLINRESILLYQRIKDQKDDMDKNGVLNTELP